MLSTCCALGTSFAFDIWPRYAQVVEHDISKLTGLFNSLSSPLFGTCPANLGILCANFATPALQPHPHTCSSTLAPYTPCRVQELVPWGPSPGVVTCCVLGSGFAAAHRTRYAWVAERDIFKLTNLLNSTSSPFFDTRPARLHFLGRFGNARAAAPTAHL